MFARLMSLTTAVCVVAGLTCGVSMGGMIFSVDHNDLPDVGQPAYPFDGWTLRGGNPLVVDYNGEKWIENKRDTSDRGRHPNGAYGTTPIPINGATIVTAIKPTRHPSGNPWTSIVDIFYDQLCLGIMNETGQVKVKVSGSNGANPIWTSAADKVVPEEPGVLSLTVGPEANPAFEVFWRGEGEAEAISLGTGNGNTGGNPYTNLYPSANGRGYAQYINLGGNDPDAWPIFNGLIGDTHVFDTQLSPVERGALETQVMLAMGMAVPEPSTLVLLGMGLLGLLLARRRK